MSVEKPLVSVLMTAYNREAYIAEAIESVLASTYSNFELIIVDDVSTDNTVAIAKGYECKDKRVRVYQNDQNLKDYPNRNKAATYAKGKYIKYLDSDDMILDFGLEYCVTEMEKYPTAALGTLLLFKDITTDDSIAWAPEKIIHEHFFTRSYLGIGPTGTIFRRDRFEEMNGFDTRFGVASDNFFNIKLASLYPVVLLPKVFFFYREHEGQEKKSTKGYLRFGYLYFKELMEQWPMPLQKREVSYLRKKLDKRHSLGLVNYFLKTRDSKGVMEIMRATNFGFLDLLKGFFR